MVHPGRFMERGNRGRIRGIPAGPSVGPADARVPPHDLDAERAVIGAMLVSEAAVSVVSERLQDADFYSETHRVLYRCMMRLAEHGNPIDQLTLAGELRRSPRRASKNRLGFKAPHPFRLADAACATAWFAQKRARLEEDAPHPLAERRAAIPQATTRHRLVP